MISQPITEQTKERLRSTLYENRALFLELLPEARRKRKIYEAQEKIDEVIILNVLEFTVFYMYDINCLLDDIVSQQEGFRVRLYTRFLILTIYEVTKKLRALLAKEFQQALINKGVNDSFIEAARNTHKCFVRLFDRCEELYEDVRHGVVAHRVVSAEEQIQLFEKTNAQDVADLAIELLACTQDLIKELRDFLVAK